MNNFTSGNQIEGLSAGSYTLQITDDNQCYSNLLEFEITSPGEIYIEGVFSLPVSCFGGTDGQITISGQGGTGAYSYFVDALYTASGQAPYTVTNLSSNNYTIVLSDANGCQVSTSQFISQPTPLVSNLSVSNVGCSSSLDGSASVNPSGGIQNYTVLWSNGSSQFNQNQLGSGNYSVSITDANGCQLVESFQITEPSVNLIVDTLLCSDSNNGQIQASITNANPSSLFSALWNDDNAQTTFTAVNLSAGQYTVTLSDQFGCVLTATGTLEEPDSITVFVEHGNLCEDKTVASALVLTSGGETPYNYLWSTNEETELVQLSSPGSYSVEVTDHNGCQKEVSFTLDPILPIELNFITQAVSCLDNIDGSAEVLVEGGYSPYVYLWSNFEETPQNNQLSSGSYGVTVTDNYGCTAYQEVTVAGSNEVCIYPYSAFSPNGDMNNDYWEIDNIELYPDGLVEVFNRWGDRVFSTKKYINAWDGAWDGTFNNQLLPSATYYYVINLNNGEEPLVGTVTIVR